MTIDVDELERLANAATPGEWKYAGKRDDDDDRKSGAVFAPDATEMPEEIAYVSHWFGKYKHADGEFIAAVNPAVVLALIERLRAAEGIVRDLAAKDPLVFSDSSHPFIGSDYECGCCEAIAQSKYDVEHAESCPWHRATEYVK